jgi:hypothetical protein
MGLPTISQAHDTCVQKEQSGTRRTPSRTPGRHGQEHRGSRVAPQPHGAHGAGYSLPLHTALYPGAVELLVALPRRRQGTSCPLAPAGAAGTSSRERGPVHYRVVSRLATGLLAILMACGLAKRHAHALTHKEGLFARGARGAQQRVSLRQVPHDARRVHPVQSYPSRPDRAVKRLVGVEPRTL